MKMTSQSTAQKATTTMMSSAIGKESSASGTPWRHRLWRAMRAVPPEVVNPPTLPAQLEPRTLTSLEAQAVIEECRLEACTLSRTKATPVRFYGVHLVGVALDESELPNLTWQDVICERCNLSMVNWRGARLTRAVVRGCRVTGGKLSEGELDDVRFIDCQLDYASFADTRFRQVVFESCQLRDANFRGADLAGTRFVECDVQRADFAGAKLRGADVSSSNANGITVGAGEVRGLVVSRQQAADLATLFGLVVRD
jgi:uncharacterized protein YjbI with pentapeptide repeats